MSREAPTPLQLLYLFALLAVSTLFLGRILWPFFSCLFLALFLADLFRPLYESLTRFLPRALASLVTCLVMGLVLMVPVLLFVEAFSGGDLVPAGADGWGGAAVGGSIRQSSHWARLPELAALVGLHLEAETISLMMAELGDEVYRFVGSHAGAWAMGAFRLLIQFLVMIVTCFFVLIDRDRFTSFWLHLSPLPIEQNRRLVRELQGTARAALIGNGVGSIIQGVAGGLLFAWLGLPSPFFWGFVMFVLAFLPIVGIGVIMLPAGLYLFTQGNINGVIVLAVAYVILTLLVEYLLKAKLTGDQAHMHPLLALLALIGGLESFGVMGLVYGPLVVTAFTCLADIYLTDYQSAIRGGIGRAAAAAGYAMLEPPLAEAGPPESVDPASPSVPTSEWHAASESG